MSAQPASRAVVSADLSLADALAAVQTATLPARRRQEMRSAVRTIARVLDKPPERVPANPRLLAARLSGVAPRAYGISPARWNNIRSLARAALALVQPMSPGRQRNALSPAWRKLWDQLGSRGLRWSLCRFVRFCSARRIDPDGVSDDTFTAFRLFLADTLLKEPGRVFAQAARAWRAAQAAIDDWPRFTVEVPAAANGPSAGTAFQSRSDRISKRGTIVWPAGTFLTKCLSGQCEAPPSLVGNGRFARSLRLWYVGVAIQPRSACSVTWSRSKHSRMGCVTFSTGVETSQQRRSRAWLSR